MNKVLLFVTACVLVISSCSENVCDGVACLNEGECNNGVCDCPEGFSGENCETAVLPQYDTIFPNSYFPAYPGSYWRYLNANNDTVLIETSSEYELDRYTFYLNIYSDYYYVPFYNGIPIYEYKEHLAPTSFGHQDPLVRIVSDTLMVGNSWVSGPWGDHPQRRRVIVAMDTVVTINGIDYGPTIVVAEYVPDFTFWKKYYTKDIGIVKEEWFGYDTLHSKHILDYYINQ